MLSSVFVDLHNDGCGMGEGIMTVNTVQEQLAQNGWFVIDPNQIQFSNSALVFTDASSLEASLLAHDCNTLGLAPDPLAIQRPTIITNGRNPTHQLQEPFECLFFGSGESWIYLGSPTK